MSRPGNNSSQLDPSERQKLGKHFAKVNVWQLATKNVWINGGTMYTLIN